MNRVLGRWIAVLRMDCGLTRRKLAERLGVPPSTVERWESESETVPPECLGRLAEALEVPLHDLLALHEQSSRSLTLQVGPLPTSTRRMRRYKVVGTREDMLLAGGETALTLCEQVEERMTARLYAQLGRSFPRDSELQLMAAYHVIAAGGDLRKVRLMDLGCGLQVNDADRESYALILPGDDWLLLLVPQVSLSIPTCPQIYRADFLGLYVDSYGHRHWLDLTIDDVPAPPEHANCPTVLGIPRFSYGSAQVRRSDFGSYLVEDIRRYMVSDVVSRGGTTSLRVRQPRRQDPPLWRGRNDLVPGS